MQVGSHWIDVTPRQPLDLLGQMHVRQGQYILDPLTVNTLVLDDGQRKVALVSCDVCILPDDWVQQVQKAAEVCTGIPARSILITATHTHVAPCTVSYLAGKSDPAFLDRLQQAVVESVARAMDNRSTCELVSDTGYIEHMGWNRRGMHANGKADMYWGSWREDFAGLEGPRDGAVPVIAARQPDGLVKAVITSFASHPNCCEGGSFYSADIPGAVRKVLRDNLGPQVGVVYLTGAAGNTAPSIMENNPRNIQPWRGPAGLRRSGLYLGGEIIKVIQSSIDPMKDPSLALAQTEIPVELKEWPGDFDLEKLASVTRQYYIRCQADWARMLREQNPCPLRLNVLRIGEAAICTNPAELFVEFGLEIRQKSRAKTTLISQLTDGYVGYVPTRRAFANGGYETWPAYTSKLGHAAGETFVAKTVELLEQAAVNV